MKEKIIRKFLIIWLLGAVCFPLLSQNETTATAIKTQLQIREFDGNKLAEYRADEDYNMKRKKR